MNEPVTYSMFAFCNICIWVVIFLIIYFQRKSERAEFEARIRMGKRLKSLEKKLEKTGPPEDGG